MASGGAQGRLIVNSSDPLLVPNDGIRTNLTAYPVVPLPSNTSFQVGAEEVIGTYDAVFGFFQNAVPYGYTVPFFSVFTNATDQNVHLAYWSGFPLVAGNGYDFSLLRANGTTWVLTVNGQVFGSNASLASFDFGATSATWAGGVGFSEVAIYATTTPVPPQFTATLALAVHRSGSWYLPAEGRAYFNGTGGAPWGVEGRDQHPTLAPGEVVSGTSISNFAPGTELWIGGPVVVRVTLTARPSTTVATNPVGVTVTVATPASAPLPGVDLYLTDALGGTVAPSQAVTNSSGSAEALFLTPNVSAATADQVTADVTLFGYIGSQTAPVNLTPTTQILVRPSSPRWTTHPGGTVQVALETTTAFGVPVPNVLLTFTVVSGGASITPTFGTSDQNAQIIAVVAATQEASTATILVNVAAPGTWGHASFTVEVVVPSPPWYVSYGPDLVDLALAAVLVTVVYVAVVRVRRRRRPIPAMPLRTILRQARAEARFPPPRENGPNGGSVPPSRTPPESGTP